MLASCRSPIVVTTVWAAGACAHGAQVSDDTVPRLVSNGGRDAGVLASGGRETANAGAGNGGATPSMTGGTPGSGGVVGSGGASGGPLSVTGGRPPGTGGVIGRGGASGGASPVTGGRPSTGGIVGGGVAGKAMDAGGDVMSGGSAGTSTGAGGIGGIGGIGGGGGGGGGVRCGTTNCVICPPPHVTCCERTTGNACLCAPPDYVASLCR